MSGIKTDFLLATMTRLTGAGNVFNLWGSFYDYNYSATPEEADARALFSDWAVVGDDIRTVLRSIDKDQSQQLELELDANG